jgi:predicted component of type VI protein secretion system
MSTAPQKSAAQAQATVEALAPNEFSDLLQREFKPKTEQAREAVENAVKTLAVQALENTVTISNDAYRSVQAIITEIDRKLSEQINQILHHEDFQQLEGAWRGLHYLVNNTETDEQLKIRVMCASKREVARSLKRHKGIGWDQSPLFKKIYEAEYGQNTEHTAWRSLRDSEDARYIGLAMPRFLARLPYGARTNPVDEFEFEEETDSASHNRYTWANSAYAMGVNINRSFKQYGWCTSIRGVESGGAVENLPTHTFPTDDGGVDMKCPTEIAISDRREAELAKNGFMPLVHRKNSDFAAFIGAQSLQLPAEYYDADATANANLAARLPYLFACCRFAHYLKCIVRDKIGSFREREDMERWLNDWIMNYVDGSPGTSSQDTKAMKPLAAAEVQVEAIEDNPGYYAAKFFLRPHYQLEGLTVSLRLVSKLPSNKKDSS